MTQPAVTNAPIQSDLPPDTSPPEETNSPTSDSIGGDDGVPTETLPPELAIGFCNRDDLAQSWIGVDSSTLVGTRPPFGQTVLNTYLVVALEGSPVRNACGETFYDKGNRLPFRGIYSQDFSHVIGVASDGDTDSVVTLDARGAGELTWAVEPDPQSDFGGAPARTLAATFTPDGTSIVWRESDGGSCTTYRAPFVPGEPVRREELPDLVVGEGGMCYGSQPGSVFFAFSGGDVIICTDLFAQCQDLSGNDIEETRGMANPKPQSSRFEITPTYLASNGLFYFVATDRDTGESLVYSWQGEGTEPVEVTSLGQGRWYPLGELMTDQV